MSGINKYDTGNNRKELVARNANFVMLIIKGKLK